MKSRFISTGVALIIALAVFTPIEVIAQADPDSVRLAELERRIEALTREIEEVRLGEQVVTRADTSVLGFGPAASKVYNVGQGVSIGGYGEMLYEDFSEEREDGAPSGKRAQLDALRAIIYVGYKFNDKILFNSEIEFEHGSTGQSGSASVEFAYLDYRFSDAFGVRAGLLLSPMGFLNELHEPPVFLGTERPVTENRIIPSTWRENGIGIFGQFDDFAYRAYVLNSLDGVGGGSSKAGGFSASGLRGGRQKGSKAEANSFSGVARIDYTGTLGLLLGTSAYYGNSGHGRTLDDGRPVDVGTFIWEAHAEYKALGWDLRGLLAVASLSDIAELNELRGLDGSDSVGESMLGWYLQAGYDVLRSVPTNHQLSPYVRFEQVDTQREVPSGFESDPKNDERIVSLGLSWKPITSVIGKLDYQIHSNGADSGVNQFNIAIGYLF